MHAAPAMMDRKSDPPVSSPEDRRGDGTTSVASDRLCLGIIVGAHGIKGRVRVKSFTAEPEAIADYGPLQDESGTRRFVLELTGAQKGVLIVGVEGIDDRNAAERLKGLRLYVSRDALPAPEEGEFYEADLIGLTAAREDGSVFGIVRGVNDFGAGASIEIEEPSGKTVVVPFTSAAVPVVDIANKRLVIVPPPGLYDAPSSPNDGRGDGESVEATGNDSDDVDDAFDGGEG